MVNRNSIYVLNKKDPDAIVYPSANGKPIRITRDDFSTEKEFLAFKKWSDENFHEEEKLDHRESNHTLAADELSEAALAVPATDVVLERQHSRDEKRRAASEMVVKLIAISDYFLMHLKCGHMPARLHTDYGPGSSPDTFRRHAEGA